ncbi:MAG TPA: AsmA-like C-terminal region-containing protein, partial [Vicinamibacterales bacterium]|nr:AsmA-like C-terminal region-containing protein [Vicinamibacterales bacterium]
TLSGWVIEEIISTGARLEVAPEDPTGTPLEFEILDVRLRDFSLEAPAAFEARLINPKPHGEIRTSGIFGPWNGRHPRLTPLAGDYTLSDADMSVFGGLGGTLSSTGQFRGVLEAIAVSGRTTMADFQVDTGRHPLPLEATFEARVDGTNGNTYLDRVSATLAGSALEATGEVAGTAGSDGKTVRLDTSATEARLEDFIRLVVSQDDPPMAGLVAFDARLELPPGEQPVVDRLRLDGQFTIRRGRFASDAVQDKVDELSRRGQGEPRNEEIDNVLSNFSGHFRLRGGRLALPDLRFAVRGATVELGGSYGLRGELLDFEGRLLLDAKLSQATTGFKSVLLRVIDPFFRKHGAGAVLPIRIGGTVTDPDFGLKMFGR